MSIGLIVLTVLFAAPLLWIMTTGGQRPAGTDNAERASLVRHEAARSEIEAIGQATMKLMRAVAAASAQPEPQRAVHVRPRWSAATRAGSVTGFAWTLAPVANSPSSPGRVTFYMPFTTRR